MPTQTMVAVLVTVFAGASVVPFAGCGGDDPHHLTLRLLTYNIGNPDDTEPHYPLRMSYQSYEDYMGAQIRSFHPDVVFLQEVLPPQTCAAFTETDAARTCYEAADRPAAAQRILGPDYSVVCDARQHVECMGVKTSFGTIAGLTPGGFVVDGAETPPLPLQACVYANGECDNHQCDAESTVSAVTVATAKGDLRLVHAHPNAPGTTASGGFYLGDECRILQLQQIFEGVAGFGDTPLVAAGPTIVAGDFNLEPFILGTPAELALWTTWVGDGARFTDFDPKDAEGTYYGTRRGAYGMAIDHVLATAATGKCTVYGKDVLGPDPGTAPLDADFDWSLVPGGEEFPGRIDHFALVCDLRVEIAEPAR